MVIAEGLGIGILGMALAIVAGTLLGIFWVEIQFPALLGWKLDLHLPWRFAAVAGALTVILCLTEAILPSPRAARLSVPEAIRNE
jgi:ABC-type antimicrobial peptide transport system permease subunit